MRRPRSFLLLAVLRLDHFGVQLHVCVFLGLPRLKNPSSPRDQGERFYYGINCASEHPKTKPSAASLFQHVSPRRILQRRVLGAAQRWSHSKRSSDLATSIQSHTSDLHPTISVVSFAASDHKAVRRSCRQPHNFCLTGVACRKSSRSSRSSLVSHRLRLLQHVLLKRAATTELGQLNSSPKAGSATAATATPLPYRKDKSA
jgi:hypothetical protein